MASTEEVRNCIRRRAWCFTSFKFDVAGNLVHPTFHSKTQRYLLYAPEVCPTTGRRHIQGYFQTFKQSRFNTVLKLLPEGSHLEPANGSAAHNRTYIMGPYESKQKNKSKPYNPDFKEFGNFMEERQRTDLKQLVESHSTFNECILADPEVGIKYAGGIRAYYMAKGCDYKVLEHKPFVVWLWGTTGKGKSRAVRVNALRNYHENECKHRLWRKPSGIGFWFDGYSGQEVVFIDEVRGTSFPSLACFLELIDYDPPPVPVKGGFTQFHPWYIYITSAKHPLQLRFNGDSESEDLEQLARRCDVIYNISDDGPVDIDNKYANRGQLPDHLKVGIQKKEDISVYDNVIIPEYSEVGELSLVSSTCEEFCDDDIESELMQDDYDTTGFC
jgi:hypothetical protein